MLMISQVFWKERQDVFPWDKERHSCRAFILLDPKGWVAEAAC